LAPGREGVIKGLVVWGGTPGDEPLGTKTAPRERGLAEGDARQAGFMARRSALGALQLRSWRPFGHAQAMLCERVLGSGYASLGEPVHTLVLIYYLGSVQEYHSFFGLTLAEGTLHSDRGQAGALWRRETAIAARSSPHGESAKADSWPQA